MYIEFQSETMQGRDLLGVLAADSRIILKLILKKYDMRVCTGFIRHRTGTSGGLL
jgi:hypothetical protein